MTEPAAPLKVMTLLGTRPEIVRLSVLIGRLDETVDHVVVHTGQNYDYQLNEVLFSDLGVRPPDHFLDVHDVSLGSTLGNILARTEEVLRQEVPDAFIVLGDTNSAIGAVMAKRLHVPVYHLEGGNRSFDENVPEEVNRRIVDHIADFNLVYSERSRQHLLSEGLSHRRIYLIGSPIREVYDKHRVAIGSSPALDHLGLAPGGYYLMSVHREENVDSRDRLTRVVDCVEALASDGLPVVVSTHPRTRDRLERFGLGTASPLVRWLEPFGYHDYMRLQLDASCVVSDSGSISEEAAIAGFPAVTLRDSIERPEALDTGTVVMSGLDASAVVQCVAFQRKKWTSGRPSSPPEYRITDTSNRVLGLVLGTARLSNSWAGVRAAHLEEHDDRRKR